MPDEEVPEESDDSAVRDEGESAESPQSPGNPDEDGVAEARLRMPPWAPEVSFRRQPPDQPSNSAAAPGAMTTWAWQGDPGAAKARTGTQSSRAGRLGEFKYVGIMVIGACLFAAAGGFVVLSVLGGPRLPQDDAGATVMPGAYGMGQSRLALAATSAADSYSTPKPAHGAAHTATPSRSAGSSASKTPISAPNDPASSTAASAAASAAETQAVTAPTSAAATTAAVAETGTFTGYDALCLDDWARRTVDGNQIIIEGCNETSAQSWTVEPDGTMRVEGMCMDVPGSSPAAGSLVELWSCDGAGTQAWRAGPDGTLVNASLKLCLDDPDSDSSPGTGLDVAACTDGANQQWTFQAG